MLTVSSRSSQKVLLKRLLTHADKEGRVLYTHHVHFAVHRCFSHYKGTQSSWATISLVCSQRTASALFTQSFELIVYLWLSLNPLIRTSRPVPVSQRHTDFTDTQKSAKLLHYESYYVCVCVALCTNFSL